MFVATACSALPGASTSTSPNTTSSTTAEKGDTGQTGKDGAGITMTAIPASSFCPNGGAALTSSANPTSPSFICNGTSITTTSLPAGFGGCPAGGVLLSQSGSATTDSVCNGTKGTDGTNGTNGTNGLNGIAVTTLATGSAGCPLGGLALTINSIVYNVCNVAANAIDKIFCFHVNTYTAGDNDIASESANYWTVVDVRLTKFKDGSGSVLVNGMAHPSLYTYNYSHTFAMPAGAAQQHIYLKLDSPDNMRIGYYVNLSPAIPAFSATIDTDGDFTNNTPVSFTLSESSCSFL